MVDEARKKLKICLICVVSAAVLMGCIYYFLSAGEGGTVNEGTLVCQELEETCWIWQLSI